LKQVEDLIVHRPEGLYCPQGDFYIDPWRPVERAVITHAHADHARPGNLHYLAAEPGAGILRARLGDIDLQTLRYGESIAYSGIRLSLHPAGHVLGSAQVRVEHAGGVWVVSGDYFLTGSSDETAEDISTCAPFEFVRCDCFITESTFGLPIYRWQPQREIFKAINDWWASNASAGRASLLMGYSFGKAQRILKGVDSSIGPILLHGAIEPINRAYREAGVVLPEVQLATEVTDKTVIDRALVVAPPSVAGSRWTRRFGNYSDAFASGWMQVRGARRRRSVDRGFVLSDHADWPGLQRAIAASGAERVIVTHGREDVLVRWLAEKGYNASSFQTDYGETEGTDALNEPAPATEGPPKADGANRGGSDTNTDEGKA
jgi:putative mRNA 3-end processing factor